LPYCSISVCCKVFAKQRSMLSVRQPAI